MTETTRITPADIETKFRDIQGQVGVVAEDSRKKAVLAGGVVTLLLALVVYLLGRKAGKKRSSVLEIRRL